ncbi:MAG: hypothetical protein COA86_06675 [Kangiella sp.]|nr:MAG: hypothetical protein COA86_06675 [Kangiella sp.]
MSSGLLSKLFVLFAFFCFLLIIQSEDKIATNTSITIEPKIVSLQNKEDFNQYKSFYLLYNKIIDAKDVKNSLELIEQALIIADSQGFPDKSILRLLHILAAEIHQSRWHFTYAIKSLNKAQSLVFDSQISKDIKRLQSHLSQIDQERGLKTQYIATKNTGPAKHLSGKILVAYVFVDDGLSTRWSNKTKLKSLQVLQSTQSWQIEKAKQYNVSGIEFINRTYVARKNPLLRQLKSNKINSPRSSVETVSFKSSNKAINQFVISTMNSLGAKDVNEFLLTEMQKNQVTQAVLILHTNQDQRSFARRCGYTHQRQIQVNGVIETEFFSNCTDEYVMLMEKVKRNRWDKLHYAQAHEVMHVFGAADLYNIKNANDYAVTDIMNYQSKQLQNSDITPITAYAIGWQEAKPNAPFTILER